MLKKRLIAVIILRDGQVVQSVQFQHTNVIHYDAIHAIETFNRWSVDEIVFINVSRTENGKEQFLNIVEKVSEKCFVPLTAGGWITDLDYACALVSNGADKLLLNTAFRTNTDLVKQIVRKFGSQCVVASIDFKKTELGAQVAIDRGQELIGIHPVEWAQYVQRLGAGELFVNCIDHDGKRRGYAIEELQQICQQVDIPVIAFGGVFTWQHLLQGIEAGADAVAAANIFHYTEHSTKRAKTFLRSKDIAIRKEGIL